MIKTLKKLSSNNTLSTSTEGGHEKRKSEKQSCGTARFETESHGKNDRGHER